MPRNVRKRKPSLAARLAPFVLTLVAGTSFGVYAYFAFLREPVVPENSVDRLQQRRQARQPVDEPRASAPPQTPPPPKRTEPERPADSDSEPVVSVRSLPTEAEAGDNTLTPANAGASAVRPVSATEISRGSTRRNEVALTFDAGADWRPVRKIIEALGANNIRSTFFLTGEWVQKNPKSTRLIADHGHEIGNHSWNHPPFTTLSDADIRQQLQRTEDIIQETIGRSSRPFFRPPLGDRDRRVREIVASEGYHTVYWTLDSRDSVDPGITAAQIRDRVLGGVRPGSIVLLHCGSQATADAVPEILEGLRRKGLTPVTVKQLIQE